MKWNVEKYGNPYLVPFAILFFCEIAIMSTKVDALIKAPALYWVFVVPATFRLAHTVSFNAIAQFLRGAFTRIMPDSAGGSECIEAIPGNDLRNAIGRLLECPICSGTWSAMFLLTIFAIFPPIGWAFAFFLGVAGYNEILHWFSELLEWAGRLARELSGSEWLKKHYGTIFPPEKII